MSSNQIKSLLKQAEVYRSQGLLNEAEKKYELVAELIQSSNRIQNKEKLLKALSKKMSNLKKEEDAVESAPTKPQMSAHVNDLIKKLFTNPQTSENDKDAAALEGAIALAKFGQFEGAIAEFSKLLGVDSYRVAAAKNVIRCHMTLDSTDIAEGLFAEWQAGGAFTDDQLEQVRNFFDDMLDKKGVKKEASVPAIEEDEEENEDEEFLDISAVAITLDSGPRQGEQIELDVSFQSGNIISLIISGKDQALIESLQVGIKLDDVHFYSPIAIFRGSGTVAAKTQIASGPKQGDYSLDIKIESI